MVRLLDLARRHPADPDLYTGLVMACRYSGLLEASLAADERARRLDPAIHTSVAYTYFQLGDPVRALERADGDPFFVPMYSLIMQGRPGEALPVARTALEGNPRGMLGGFLRQMEAAIARDAKAAREAAHVIRDSEFKDPEGLMLQTWKLCGAGATDTAIEVLRSIENAGFYCTNLIERESWFQPIREDPEVRRILAVWEGKRAEAALAFNSNGGEQVLGSVA
jgi:hypothetical protein